MADNQILIGDVASETGVPRKTIRYYERIGLLPEPERGKNNYRIYSQDAIRRINFIKKSQSLGFKLSEIKEILTLRDRGFRPCNHVRDLLQQRIVDLEKKLEELTTLRNELQKLEDEWAEIQPVEDGLNEGFCPQIERVNVRFKEQTNS